MGLERHRQLHFWLYNQCHIVIKLIIRFDNKILVGVVCRHSLHLEFTTINYINIDQYDKI